MKKIYISILLAMACTGSTWSQSAGRNYVQHKTMLNPEATQSVDQIQYIDGLGRAYQDVQKTTIGGTAEYLIRVKDYDFSGKEKNVWLPITHSADYIDPATFKGQVSGRYNGDTRPYTAFTYEASPLGRLLKEHGPGEAWGNKSVQQAYILNTSAGERGCSYYYIDNSNALVRGADYAGNQLTVYQTTDEDGNVGCRFTDKQGKVILDRVLNGATYHDTYYVYDYRGNLSYVLPPMIDQDISAANLNNFAYRYRYDCFNRLTGKKLPGAEWVYYVYDRADRIIFTQDGENRQRGEWMFSVPDALGRVCLTGTCTNTFNDNSPISEAVTATWSEGTSTNYGYTVTGASLTGVTFVGVNFYDGYGFMQKSYCPIAGNADFTYEYMQGYGVQHTGSFRGLQTGTLTAVLGENSTMQWITDIRYYDERGRVIQVKSNNHLAGGMEKEYILYTFTGQPKARKHVHGATGKTTQTELYTYTYDHADRLAKVEHQLNTNGKITLAEYAYDNLGRLRTQKYHGNTASLSTYTYNIRNWISGISGSHFTQDLYYNAGPGVPCYNGNISSMTWTAGNESATRGYKFTYDGLSRLTEANYGEGASITANAGRFTEKITSYDKHGNIQGLQRYGKTSSSAYGLVDHLSFGYTGNQMKYANDAIAAHSVEQTFHFVDGSNSTGAEFVYDTNGNMTKDLNKNIMNVQYNCLNLPISVQFSDSRSSAYLYDALGIKRRVTHQGGGVNKTTDYCGHVIYEDGALSKILTEEGYITLSETTPTYHYYVKDHLGNNRVVLHQNGSTVEQVNHYYPFGGLFDQSSEDLQAYKYNGKELDRTYGLDLYDYSARYMDGALGRFTTVDPMAEKYYGMSPYTYCANNPMRFVDPTGMVISPYYDKNGNYLGVDEKGFAGEIYITDQETFNVNSNNGVADSRKMQSQSSTFNAKEMNQLHTPVLSLEAESKILTDVLTKMEDPVIKIDNLYNGKVSIREKQIRRNGENIAVGYNNPAYSGSQGRFQGTNENGQIKVTATKGSLANDLYSVESVQNYLGVHEYWGHGVKQWSTSQTHYKCYDAQIKHPTFRYLDSKQKQDIYNLRKFVFPK